MPEFYYTAYGLNWQLPFSWPDLRSAQQQNPDVVVRLGSVPKELQEGVGIGPLRRVSPGAVLFNFPQAARFLIRDGNEIIIQPEPDVDDSVIILALMGTCAAILLHQRGILPIHASAIKTPRGAVLFTGHSGFGKSTLLGAFLERGYAMLNDDIAAIETRDHECPRVLPGYPFLKLWSDSAKKLSRPIDSARRVRPELEKYFISASDQLTDHSVPLYAVYALRVHNKPDLSLETLQADKKFNVLLDYTWQKMILKRMGRYADHFKMAVTVANHTHISRVSRPEQPFLLHELADLIESDFS